MNENYKLYDEFGNLIDTTNMNTELLIDLSEENVNFTPLFSPNAEITFEGHSKINKLPIVKGNLNRPLSISFERPVLMQARWHKKKRINKKWLKRYGIKQDWVTININKTCGSFDMETNEFMFDANSSNIKYILKPYQKCKNLKIEIDKYI